MNEYDKNWYKKFDRHKGKRQKLGSKGSREKTILFSYEKHINDQGQSFKEWENKGLLAYLIDRIRQIEQYTVKHAVHDQLIKQYTKVGFPPESKFTEPKHVSPDYWAVIHLKPNSKEVIVGYLENSVFYIVFLDEDHLFWPSDIQSRGKKKR